MVHHPNASFLDGKKVTVMGSMDTEIYMKWLAQGVPGKNEKGVCSVNI